jgi:hypothetical protein
MLLELYVDPDSLIGDRDVEVIYEDTVAALDGVLLNNLHLQNGIRD